MDNGPRAYNGAIANRHAWKNRTIGANHHPVANHHMAESILFNQIFMSQNRRIVANNGVGSYFYSLRKHDIDHNH